MRALLALRAVFFLVIFPGTVAAYLPYRILRSTDRLGIPDLTLTSAVAALVAIAGGAVLLTCVWQFAAKGRGTLAPIDPPRRLVVSGPYRITRNPMYHGVLLLLLGEAWMFSSWTLLEYATGIFFMFHCFVVLYEEHALESKFGESYVAYRRSVPRWGFTLHPYPRDPAGVES